MSENTEARRTGGQYIKINDWQIRYFEEGQGETVIFIHGLGQAMYTFRKNVHVLSEYCHVVSIDLLGHGLSDKPEEFDYTIDDFSKLIADFMDAMEIPKATLLGFSTGAIIALDTALKYPNKVDRLILLSPGGVTKTYPTQIKLLTAPIISDLLFTFFSASMVQKVLNQGFYDPSLLTKDIVRHYYKVLSNRAALDATMNALAAWDDTDLAYELSEIQAPAYIFWGEDDTWHSLDMLELYEEALPDVYSATFAQCGHFLHVERADELNKKLIEIVSSDF